MLARSEKWQPVTSQADRQKALRCEAALSVLVLSPAPRVHGGVSVFVEAMKTRLRHCDVTSLWVGSIQDHGENLFTQLWRVLVTPLQVARLVRRKHFDVVHINPSLTYKSILRDGLILLGLRLIRFRRVLVYFHGWPPEVDNGMRRVPGLCRVFAWILNGMDHIAVLSPDFKMSLETMGVTPERITLTFTMFDGTGLKAVENVSLSRRRSILFMSRFVRRKGIYELLNAFASIAPDFPDVDLVMAGDGEENRNLRNKASALGLRDRILFPGYVSGIEKSRLLCACTVFALPTYCGEGMPVALLEAMGAGNPLLTARDGAIPYIISEPENGLVLRSVTADTVEAALRRLLNDPDYCRKTGERNAAYAWERFEATAVTADIEALYHDLACR